MEPYKIYDFEDEKAWLKGRLNGIGGSDASAVVGKNPYKTNIELFEEKTGRRIAPDISEKPLESLGVECTLESALLMAQIKEAMAGNTKAAYFVAQYAGQNAQTAADDAEQKRRTERMAADTEKIRRSSGHSEHEDEGVEIINDAPEETGPDIGDHNSEVSADI